MIRNNSFITAHREGKTAYPLSHTYSSLENTSSTRESYVPLETPATRQKSRSNTAVPLLTEQLEYFMVVFVLKKFFLEATKTAALIFRDKLELCGHFCTKKSICGSEVKITELRRLVKNCSS